MLSLKLLFEKYPLGLFGYRILKPRLVISLLWMLWGVFIGLSFPPFEFSFLVFLLPLPFAFCTPAINSLRAMRYGWSFGFGYFFVSLFWLYTIHIGAVFFLASVCALFYGICFILINLAEKYGNFSNFAKILFFAAIFVSGDFLRGHLFTGFPWNFPGNALWHNPAVAVIRLGGVYAQTFIIIVFGLIITSIIKNWQTKSIKQRFFQPVLTILITFLIFNIPVNYDKFEHHFQVMPVQGNIPLMRVYTNEQLKFARDTYINLTEDGLKKHQPQMIIWPETAVPAPLFWDRNYYFPFKRLINEHKLPMLVGTIHYRQTNDIPKETLLYNSVMLLNSGPKEVIVTESYDKTHPVPFGEFTPLGDKFPWLRKIIGMGRDLTAGNRYTVFSQFTPAEFGVNICYEDVFPDISRKFILNGANMIITITNDAWYHESAGSRQHFANSVFRAIENNVYFLRSGNRSYTSLTHPSGKVEKFLTDEHGNVFTKGNDLFKIPFTASVTKTFYTKYGDIFSYLCLLLTIICIANFSLKYFLIHKPRYNSSKG